MTFCYHSYSFLYEKGIALSCALTEKHVQTKIENAIYLYTVQCQHAEIQLHVLEYGSETAKRIFLVLQTVRTQGFAKNILLKLV